MDSVSTSNKTPNKSMIWLIAILVIAVIIAFLWWWNYRKYISTNDANLDSYRVSVASQVMGPMGQAICLGRRYGQSRHAPCRT